MSEAHAYPARGAVVPADHPEDWVGDVDSHRIAYPDRVERAKEFFPQAPFEDFQIEQTGLDRFRLIDNPPERHTELSATTRSCPNSPGTAPSQFSQLTTATRCCS